MLEWAFGHAQTDQLRLLLNGDEPEARKLTAGTPAAARASTGGRH